MNRNGIGRMILSPHRDARDEALIAFGQTHADRLTIAVRTKTGALERGAADPIIGQIRRAEYGGMQEVLFWHQEKEIESRGTAREVELDIEAPAVVRTIEAVQARGFPFMVHYEFNGDQSEEETATMMAKFERTLARFSGTNFALVHRGQLDAEETHRLIEKFPNFYSVLSHSIETQPEYGFTSIFQEGCGGLDADWRELLFARPERFLLSFDAPFGHQWANRIPREAAIWRRTLQRLPADVAHKIGHENAERLWRLPPTIAMTPSDDDSPETEAPALDRPKGGGKRR